VYLTTSFFIGTIFVLIEINLVILEVGWLNFIYQNITFRLFL